VSISRSQSGSGSEPEPFPSGNHPAFISRFREIAAVFPDRPAIVVDGISRYSYSDLEQKAIGVARYLTSRGLGFGDLIALHLEKSPEYLVVLLGSWISGCAFMPVDPSLPMERILFMLEDSGACWILGHPVPESTTEFTSIEDILAAAPCSADDSAETVIQNATRASRRSTSELEGSALNDYDSLAYVIYTSGSTGRPKGVLVPHRGILPVIDAQISAFTTREFSRVLLFYSISFDASLSAIGTAFLSGAALLIESDDMRIPPGEFQKRLRDRCITHLDIPPALARLIDPITAPDCLETLILGGESCPESVLENWSRRVRTVVVYGPTETTICSSLVTCDPEHIMHGDIGQPIPGFEYRIESLQEDLSTKILAGTPPITTSLDDGEGVYRIIEGELLISGAGVAQGYASRPELTRDRFVTRDGTRFYRTGDRVRRHPDGVFEFCGRLDRQVKIRGFRIEPEEIEIKLREIRDFKDVAVVDRIVGRRKDSRPVLVAFTVLRSGARRPDLNSLFERLKLSLPSHLIPQIFVFVDELPRTSTGKFDLETLRRRDINAKEMLRRRNTNAKETLPDLLEPPPNKPDILPLHDLHHIHDTLKSVWQDVLGTVEILDWSDFFHLGGDSIGILDVAARLDRSGHPVSLEMLYKARTFSALVCALADSQVHDSDTSIPGYYISGAALRALARLPLPLETTLSRCSIRTREGVRDRTLFLTGVTGFLGSHLLARILDHEPAKIFCLVRPRDKETPFLRLVRTFSKFNLDTTILEDPRVSFIEGDLTAPAMGLSQRALDALASEVDTIIHGAAHVNLALPYSHLEPTNVDGVLQILHLLSRSSVATLHLISTLSVLVATDRNHGRLMESDDLSQVKRVYGGYAQSKYVADRLVQRASSVRPGIRIHRLGLLTPDPRTGRSPDQDLLYMFIRGIVLIGGIPRGSENLRFDVTPIDQAAAIVSQLIESAPDGIYNIANPQSVSLGQMVGLMSRSGYKIVTLSPDQFRRRALTMRNPDERGIGATVLLALCRSRRLTKTSDDRRWMDLFQATGAEFDLTRTIHALAGTDVALPSVHDATLLAYVSAALKSRSPEVPIHTGP